jgi:bacillopeptidase F
MIWSFSIDRGATTLAVFTRSRGAWAIPLPTQSATQVTLFSDDFESDKGWTHSSSSCNWTQTTDANSPSNAWTTAPYTDACDVDLDSPSISVPSGANTIRLSFFEKHNTEDYGAAGGAAGCPCDYGQVQLSTDGGSTYTSVGGLYLGAQPAYAQSTVPLPDSAAGKTIRIRFHFHSDSGTSVPQGGWWVDDPKLTAEPQ